MHQRHIDIVTFTTLFPNVTAPNHGIFVENRLQHLLRSGQVSSRVVAPVPWFPFRSQMFGRYGMMASVPNHEDHEGLRVLHPRFPVLPKIGMSISPTMLFLSCLSIMRRLLREREFDLIDAHYFYPDGVAALLLGAILKRPVVITARGSDISSIANHNIPRAQIRWAALRAAGIVAVSEALKEALVGMGVAASRIHVLRNGVDLEVFYPVDHEAARKRLGLQQPTLLSVGHLIERKSNDLVIGAMTRLPNFVLLLAGEGPERNNLENLARRLGVSDRVRFLGPIPHRRLADLYSAADMLVLASSREGWPNVLLEAMACGTPVVASNIWGNPEVVRAPEAGCLMEERTPEGVAAAVQRLLAHLPDRSKTRLYAEKFSWYQTTVGQIRLFEHFVADRTARHN